MAPNLPAFLYEPKWTAVIADVLRSRTVILTLVPPATGPYCGSTADTLALTLTGSTGTVTLSLGVPVTSLLVGGIVVVVVVVDDVVVVVAAAGGDQPGVLFVVVSGQQQRF